MKNSKLNDYFVKALMVISGLAVLTFALIGSVYLVIAAIVIALSACLFSVVAPKPQKIRVRPSRQPLDAEYRVIRRK